MQVDFSTVLVDFNNQPLKNENADLTLRSVCIEALMAIFKDEENLSGEDKLKRYDLGMIIHSANGAVDLRVEDVALLKKLVGKGYAPIIVGQVWNLLDKKETV